MLTRSPPTIRSSRTGGSNRLLRRVGQGLGADDRQPAVADDLAPLTFIGGRQTHDQRHLDADVAYRLYHALCHPIAAVDAGKDIHQDSFEVAVRQHQLERPCHAFGRGTTAHIEEVRGLATHVLYGVHRGHRKPGAIDDAADVALQANVTQVVLGRLRFPRILLGQVAHLGHVRVPEQRVVVKRHLGIKCNHAVVHGHYQRVDLHHAGVQAAEGAVGAKNGSHRPAYLLDVETQSERDLPGLKRLQAHRGLDDDLENRLRRRLGELLDLHAALGRSDDAHAFRFSVQHDAEVKFAFKLFRYLDIDALHDLALGSGLVGHQLFAEHGFRGLPDLVVGLAELYPAGLTPGTGMDLCLDGPMPPAQFRCHERCLIGTVSHRSALNRHAKSGQQFLCLILVYVHWLSPNVRASLSQVPRAPIRSCALRICTRRHRDRQPCSSINAYAALMPRATTCHANAAAQAIQKSAWRLRAAHRTTQVTLVTSASGLRK